MHKILLIALLLAAPSAAAGELDSIRLANDLGTVLAAESWCDLNYDQAAIASFIDTHVGADDMSFPGQLTLMIGAAEYGQKDMSPSAKTAHCTQIARLAKTYGFTP